MPKLRDLSGERFGRWTVIKRAKRPEGRIKKAAYWLCKCDCGNEKVLISSCLIDYYNGNGGVSRSCGCLQSECAKETIKRRTDGDPSKNRVWCCYRTSAIKKGIRFDFTKEQFFNLTDKSCFYCGASPSIITFNEIKTFKYIHNGVDRIDNSKGYFVDNCVACCTNCNKAKLTMTQEEFRTWAMNLYNNFVKGKINENPAN